MAWIGSWNPDTIIPTYLVGFRRQNIHSPTVVAICKDLWISAQARAVGTAGAGAGGGGAGTGLVVLPGGHCRMLHSGLGGGKVRSCGDNSSLYCLDHGPLRKCQEVPSRHSSLACKWARRCQYRLAPSYGILVLAAVSAEPRMSVPGD